MTPFQVRNEDKLVFPFRPLRDLVFIYPDPPPEKLGEQQLIYIPVQFKKKYHDGVGTILAIGSGYTNDKGRFYPTPSELKPGTRVVFDIRVPWGIHALGQDGKKYYVTLCGIADIFGLTNREAVNG